MQGWIAGFQTENEDVTVNYDPVGSSGGRERFPSGGVAFAGADAALVGERELHLVERGVGAGEYDAAGEELLTTATRADGVVVDGDVLVLGLEAGDPALHGCTLGGRAGAGEGAAEGVALVGGGAARVVGPAAGGERQGAGREGGGEAGGAGQLHGIPFDGSARGRPSRPAVDRGR